MDTNRDGIIDDPIATKKKPGRKSLGLTPEEMKARRAMQRKTREEIKRYEKRKAELTLLVTTIKTLAETKTDEGIVDSLMRDNRWKITYNPNATAISGASGGRIRRPRG